MHMSSLAASRADGFYYPPDYDASKGSLKKFTGAKGKNQYEQKGIQSASKSSSHRKEERVKDVSGISHLPHAISAWCYGRYYSL